MKKTIALIAICALSITFIPMIGNNGDVNAAALQNVEAGETEGYAVPDEMQQPIDVVEYKEPTENDQLKEEPEIGNKKSAVNSSDVLSGYCGADDGKNVSWELNRSTGHLRIYGKGEMDTWNDGEFWGQMIVVPWYDYRDEITSVTVEEGITFIGWWAFAHTHITEITLPSSVRTLGQGALAYCKELRTVNLNDGLNDIEGSVFKEDTLDTLIIPESVKAVEPTAFVYAHIGNISVRGANPGIVIEDDVFFSADKKTLFYCPPDKKGTYHIPETVQTIVSYAFFMSNLSHVIFPDGLEYIGGRAFADATIQEVNIPDSVTFMDYGVFTGCSQVRSIHIGSGVTSLETDAFGNCEAATEVVLGSGITTIGDCAFDGCSSIKNIVIPDSVVSIGEYAFIECEALQDIVFSKNLQSIGYAAFAYCTNLKAITLPQGLETIGEGAFYDTGIKEVKIPDSVTWIDVNAFPNDAVVDIPDTLQKTSSGAYISQSRCTAVTFDVTYGQGAARKMLSMVNNMRTGEDAWYWDEDDAEKIRAKDLKEYTYDYELEKVAMQRAAEISIMFSHDRPDGTDCFTAYDGHGKYSYCGENIAAGQSSAKEAFKSWSEANEGFDGQGHRRNMLSDDFNAIGIGHVKRGDRDYWVQEFGYTDSPATAATEENNEKTSVSVEIIDSIIQIEKATGEPAALTIKEGEQTALPSAKLTFTTEEMWGSDCKGSVAVSNWKCADPNIIMVGDGIITGVKNGSTSLSTNVLGKTITVQVLVGELDPVKNLESKNVASGIKLTWDKTNGASGYRVYQKAGSEWKLLKTVAAKTMTDTSVKSKNGMTLEYMVEAYGGTQTAQATIKTCRLLPPAIKSVTSLKKKQMKITWKKNAKASGYEIQYSTDKSFSANVKTKTIKGAKKQALVVKGLKSGKKYYAKIRAWKKYGGETYYSAWSEVNTVKVK